jgi:uncharacterized protein (DUF58 family)
MLNNDKVGLLIFTDIIEHYIPPKKGRMHLLRIIREILTFVPEGKQTSIDRGLVYLNQVVKKKSIVFLISDFIDSGFVKSLKISSRKHDLIAIHIADRRELSLPGKGLFILKDFETGEEFFCNFSSRETKKKFRELSNENRQSLNNLFRKYNVDVVDITDEKTYEKPLFDFFLKRKQKYHK